MENMWVPTNVPGVTAQSISDQIYFLGSQRHQRQINGAQRVAFIEPPLYQPRNQSKDVVKQSRRNFGRPRAIIEREFR